MESTKIQEFDLDPNCGFAKEETAQAIREDVQGVLGAVGNGVVPQLRSPIKFQEIYSATTTAVTGTGQGVLALYLNGNDQPVIKVDGVTLINGTYPKCALTSYIHIEFKESFSVAAGGMGYGTGGLAIFY